MKKTILTTIAIIIMQITFCQPKFSNVVIDGSLTNFVKEMTKQGYTLTKTSSANSVKMIKNDNKEIELFIFQTPKTKKVYKVSTYFPKKNNWYVLKSEYERYKLLLTEKYGTPESYEYFKEPYYEGDGYEMQAVKLEKVTYISFWNKQESNLGLFLTISQFEQLQISYENTKNGEIYEKEKNEIDGSSL